MSNFKLISSIKNFTAFHHQLLGYAYSGKDCQSVKLKKVYTVGIDRDTIVMKGKDRTKPSKYSPYKLEDVYNYIADKEAINTTDLFRTGRNNSPLMALMVASGVARRI